MNNGLKSWAALAASLWLCTCQSSSRTPADLSGPECEARKTRLLKLLSDLPEKSEAAGMSVALPTATLGGALGDGPILELSPQGVHFDGALVAGKTVEQVAAELQKVFLAAALDASTTVYIAASFDTDLSTLSRYLVGVPATQPIKLLFTSPPPPAEPNPDAITYELATRVFSEANPQRREELADDAYEAYAGCESVGDVVAKVRGLSLSERWPKLRAGLTKALPNCACGELDAPALEYLLIAEQRADRGSMGSLPIPFMRDARCSASMPLATVQQLLGDIEEFEEEFSGEWDNDALRFEKVLTEERLLNYLCIALPGETLASLQRQHATLYWKVPGAAQCQAWQFEPLSAGAPLGSWRRLDPTGKLPPLSVHFRQGAEEIRLFGPATSTSKPTDNQSWACNKDYRMVGADTDSIHLEHGRWFLSQTACDQASKSSALFGGCITDLAGSADPDARTETSEQAPDTTPADVTTNTAPAP